MFDIFRDLARHLGSMRNEAPDALGEAAIFSASPDAGKYWLKQLALLEQVAPKRNPEEYAAHLQVYTRQAFSYPTNNIKEFGL